MPCYSTIRTKLNNADHLGAALAALGWKVTKENLNVYAEKGNDVLSFQRYDRQSAFSVSGNTEHLPSIGRKYAEVGVKSWASRNQFAVLENDGVNMTLVNRGTY